MPLSCSLLQKNLIAESGIFFVQAAEQPAALPEPYYDKQKIWIRLENTSLLTFDARFTHQHQNMEIWQFKIERNGIKNQIFKPIGLANI